MQAVPRGVAVGKTVPEIRPAVFGNAAQLTTFGVLVAVRVGKRRQPATSA